MGDSSRQIKRMERELAAEPPRLLDDNCIEEILVRLPAKDVIHCGTVCKAWRDITANPSFVAANARRQQDEVLLYRYVPRLWPAGAWGDTGRWMRDVVLDAVVVSGDLDSRRSLIRYPNNPYMGQDCWFLLAVVRGVLLFKKEDGVYTLCNPTVRKWANLPLLPPPPYHPFMARYIDDEREFAFYFHQPSSEYRLLCRRNLRTKRTWCVLSTGGVQPRYVNVGAAGKMAAHLPCLRRVVTAPLALHGNLHWPPPEDSTTGQARMMVVFDTLLETFHQMQAPPTTTAHLVKLFAMDGLLVGADFGKDSHIDLWFLENYDTAARWELRHRVATPWQHPCNIGKPLITRDLLAVAAACDGDGNVMLGNCRGLVVYNVKDERTVKTIDSVEVSSDTDVVVSRHVFKANLGQDDSHFRTRPSADMPFVNFND